jgi:hypothetical protein
MHIVHDKSNRAIPLWAAHDPWASRQIGRLTAPILDRLADAELQHGHHARAEHLSRLAAEMRGAV